MNAPAIRSSTALALPSQTCVVFDSALVPPRERLDRFIHHVERNLARFEFGFSATMPFEGRIETLTFGPIKINRGDCNAGRWSRTSAALADQVDHFNLYMATSGPCAVTQDSLSSVCEVGQFAFIDNGRPSEHLIHSSGVDYDVVIPRDVITSARPKMKKSAPSMVGNQTASMRLMRRYIEAILDEPESFQDPLLGKRIGEHLTDLIVLGLQPSRDSAQHAANRGLKAARLKAVLEEIQKSYSNAGISARIVAARLNISERYVQQLLEENGLSFSRLVVDLRLKKAMNMLIDRRFDALRVSEIAYECGFNDLSYFNRAFRAQYGDTPGSARSGIIVDAARS